MPRKPGSTGPGKQIAAWTSAGQGRDEHASDRTVRVRSEHAQEQRRDGPSTGMRCKAEHGADAVHTLQVGSGHHRDLG